MHAWCKVPWRNARPVSRQGGAESCIWLVAAATARRDRGAGRWRYEMHSGAAKVGGQQRGAAAARQGRALGNVVGCKHCYTVQKHSLHKCA